MVPSSCRLQAGIQSLSFWTPASAGVTVGVGGTVWFLRHAGFRPASTDAEYLLSNTFFRKIWKMRRGGYIYILASRRNGTLYVGVTNDLIRRVWEHREGLVPGFTKRYGVNRLVYYESFDTVPAAIQREKQVKNWKRAWKLRVIEEMNPDWRDLYDEIAPT